MQLIGQNWCRKRNRTPGLQVQPLYFEVTDETQFKLRWHPKQQNVRLTVADTGHGIPADRWSQLFEPFYTTKQDVGTGLGLWVAQTILIRHDGCIHVRSRIGKGTVFVTCWPKFDREQ